MILDKIYVSVGTLSSIQPVEEYMFPGWQEKPYSQIRNVEYIRKDALMEWAKELKERWAEPPVSIHSPGCVYMLEQVIDKINSM